MKRDSMHRGLESLGQTGNRLAKPPPEEPDAGNPHVRVCELTITHKYHRSLARFQPSVRSAKRFQPLHRVRVPGGPSHLRAR